MDFALNMIDDIFADNLTNVKSFEEFCNDIDEMSNLIHTNIFEAVVDMNPNFNNTANNIISNTKDTTRDVVNAYGNITDANANFIKNLWDITWRAINLVIRIVGYIINKLAYIPKAILKLADRALDIPGELKSKIKGNILLYITIDDIQAIYNKHLLLYLNRFMTIANQLSQGDMWGTFFNKRSINNGGKAKRFEASQNDMKLCNQLAIAYEQIKMVSFKRTSIDMSKSENVELYLGNTKNVKFNDLTNTSHESSYYEALEQLVKDLTTEKNNMEEISKLMGQKFDKTKANQTFGMMTDSCRRKVAESIQMVSAGINVIGNIIKAIMCDMKEIQNAINKIEKIKNKAKSKEDKKDK